MDVWSTQPQHSEPGSMEFFMEAVARRQNRISVAMVTGPIYPGTQFAMNEGDRQEIAATQLAAALEAFLFYSAIGYSGTFAEGVLGKHMAKKAILGPLYVPGSMVAGSVVGAKAYVDTIGAFEPDGSTSDKRSFWSSIGAAMAGTFGGMPDVGSY